MFTQDSKRCRRSGSLIGACLLFLMASRPAHADLVKLLNGGEVRGRLLSGLHSTRSGSEGVVLETLSGITVAIGRADLKFVTMRPLSVEEYETKCKRIPDTVDGHWELAEWCRQHSMSKQRELHLQRVVMHDPGHSKAQLALGKVWNEGAWIDRDEMMAARGYVKYKGRYVTIQELDLIQKTTSELAAEREWFQKVKLWRGWITGQNEEKSRQGMLALQNIDDPHAAPAVIKLLCEGEDSQRQMRVLAVKILSKLTGSKGTIGLVKLALFDPDSDVRYASLNGIAEEDYEFAQTAFAKELRNSLNFIVCRAANGLGRVGDKRAVEPLIEALVTSHQYQVQTNVPVGNSYTVNTDGSMSAQSGTLPPDVEIALRTGQLPQGVVIVPPQDGSAAIQRRTTTVTVEQPNREALSALQRLTGQNFGFDERTWRLWWATEKNNGGGVQPAKN